MFSYAFSFFDFTSEVFFSETTCLQECLSQMSFQRVPRFFRGLTACYRIQLGLYSHSAPTQKRLFFPFFKFCPCLCICSLWHVVSLHHHAHSAFAFIKMFHLKFPHCPVLWSAQLFYKQSTLHCEFHITVYITQKIICKKHLLAKIWAHNRFFIITTEKGSRKKQNCSDTQCRQYNSDTYWQITILQQKNR